MLERTKEHIFPRWLIELSGATEIIVYREGTRLQHSPETLTVPMCKSCNNLLGSDLEGPVKGAMIDLLAGKGLSDVECELLVRWLWKFDSIQWLENFFDDHHRRYSSRFTMKERILGQGFHEVRSQLVFAAALIAEDEMKGTPESRGQPIGIDTPMSEHDMIAVTGVFCQAAFAVSLKTFAHHLPKNLTRYEFPILTDSTDRRAKVFFPKEGYENCSQAIDSMRSSGRKLKIEHDRFFGSAASRAIINLPHKPRIELP